MLIGEDALDRLNSARVAIFGVGGVGSYVLEALVRAGVGAVLLFDADTVSESNINRQLIADYETVGMKKTLAAEARVRKISPDCKVEAYDVFVTPEYVEQIDFDGVDFIVDAIDTVSAKLALATRAEKLGIPMIASMGTGNKLDPSAFIITDIYKTSVCPLARVMRTELRKRGVKGLDVLYSKEEPKKIQIADDGTNHGKHPPASISYVPATAGLLIASHVINTLIGKGETRK
jgi:tRNA A37 threonylcarbamoyladenosine dehydratase